MNIASVALVRDAEQRVIASGTDGYRLMCRAGIAAARIIEELFPRRKRTVFVCGGGNNGGDALVAAAHLGGEVVVYSTSKADDFRNESACAIRDLPGHIPFIVFEEFPDGVFQNGDVIVDGLLGIGFHGEKLRAPAFSAIEKINASGLPAISLDVPSGIDSDTGIVRDIAVRADVTITFGAVKQGLLCGEGPALCGILRAVDIGLGEVSSDDRALTFEEACRLLPVFPADVHKNRRGELLIVAGSSDYSGAAALTSSAALRCGTGIVRLATVDARKNLPYALIVREYPAVDGVLPPDLWQKIGDFGKSSSALAAGPGWGNADPALLAGALDFAGNIVLDADALNNLARNPHLWKSGKNIVITPHPGEARRLAAAFGIEETERSALARSLALKLGATVLLKGKNTVVVSPDGEEKIILSGSPALAVAGSGDVLTGIIGAFLAMGLSPFEAACLGASLHGRIGEMAGAGSIADDFVLTLKDLLKELKI